jgi:ribosomal protein L37AE/L43A
MPRIFEDVLREGMELLNLHLNIASLGMGKDEVVRLFWSMKLNSFNCVEMEKGGGEGLSARTDCIYPKWSKFNNSCAPNCAYSIKPKAPEYPMMVRTTVAVKEGEELGIPYTEHICMSFEERQEGFIDRFHFICKCKRCLDPTDLGTFSSAVTCESCYGDRKKGIEMGVNEGYLLPEDPLKSLEVGESAIWKCNRCKKQSAAGTFLPTLKKLTRFVRKPFKNFEVVEKLKAQYSQKVLHPNHWILQKASQAILELWDTRGAKGTDECPFEAYKTHFMYRMELENVLNPGISQYRAHMQRDFVVATVTARRLEKGNTTSEEKLELLRTCYRFIREANLFFDYFKDGVPQGALNYHITANVRKPIEALMKACGQELEEDL